MAESVFRTENQAKRKLRRREHRGVMERLTGSAYDMLLHVLRDGDTSSYAGQFLKHASLPKTGEVCPPPSNVLELVQAAPQ